MRPASQSAATFDTLNAAPGIRLRPFGLPLAFDPAPWYAFNDRSHGLVNPPPIMYRVLNSVIETQVRLPFEQYCAR